MTVPIRISAFSEQFANETAAMIERSIRAAGRDSETESSISEKLAGLKPHRLVKSVREGDMVVAIGGDRVVGTGSLKATCIHSLYVEPQLWHQGIGRSLMAVLEEIAQLNLLKRTFLISAARTAGFYRRLGYGITDRLLDDQEPIYRMAKLLNAPKRCRG